ncbi:MAG: SAM-dependent methyltransferase [Clostridium sp.]
MRASGVPEEAVLLDGSLKDFAGTAAEWEQAQTAATGAACAESTESVRMTLLTGAKKLARDLAVLVRCKPVYLVGAGPGDTGLFTEKGLDCVRRADVIVYDNLISGSILNEARLDAEPILRGEAPGSHHMKQEEISALQW